MIYYHCKKKDNTETNHDHFLTCSLLEIQKNERIDTLTKTLRSLNTPNTIIDIITPGMYSYYNNNIKENSSKEGILVTKQQEIRWNNFVRVRVSS